MIPIRSKKLKSNTKNKTTKKTRVNKNSKSKQKNSKTPRQQYQAILNQISNRNIPSKKSPLTLTTEMFSKNLDDTKRSKTSMSRSFRKHNHSKLESINCLVFDNYTFITQESVIQFSGQSSLKNSRVNSIGEKNNQSGQQRKIKELNSAKKIQRAWRSFQTCKLLHKNSVQSDIQVEKQIVSKNVSQKSQNSKQQECKPTQKENKKVACHQQITEALRLIQQYRKCKSQSKHTNKSNQKQTSPISSPISEQIQKAQKTPQKSCNISLFDPYDIKIQNKNSKAGKKYGQDMILSKRPTVGNPSFVLNEGFIDCPQFKIYQVLKKMCLLQKQEQMKRLKQRLGMKPAIYQMLNLESKYDKKIQDIVRESQNIKQVTCKLKQNLLHLLKSSKLTIKRTYSAGSNVFKAISKNISNWQANSTHENPLIFDSPQSNSQFISRQNCTPEISFEMIDHDYLSPSATQSQIVENNNKKQQVAEMIQPIQLFEFVKELYLNENMYNLLLMFIEEIHQFPLISDQYLMEGEKILKKVMPQGSDVLKLINQKINPTSLEILKIIRDPEYSMEEYNLILPQECFLGLRQKIVQEYTQKQNGLKQKCFNEQPIRKYVDDKELCEKVITRNNAKFEKMRKYLFFERDIRIIYMKSIFNCLNQYFIDLKSSNCHTNSRSSIGPGELSLAIKEYNKEYSLSDFSQLSQQVTDKLKSTLNMKLFIPNPNELRDIQIFQERLNKQLKQEMNENQYKWVNYMDEVMEIWLILSSEIGDNLIMEFSDELGRRQQ